MMMMIASLKECRGTRPSLGAEQPLELEDAFYATDDDPFETHHAEDALDDGHRLLVHPAAVPGGVVAGTVALGCLVATILPSPAFLSSPRRLLSAIMRRSYRAIWSRMPVVNFPSGHPFPRSLSALRSV